MSNYRVTHRPVSDAGMTKGAALHTNQDTHT